MFKGLSKKAQKLLSVYSQEEAKRSNSESLLPEHVILALIKSGDGTAYKVLQNLKINIISLQIQLEQVLPARIGSIIYGDVPPSRRLKSMLDNASIEARLLRHDYIGTEHLLLASVKENQSIVSIFFGKESISIEEIRHVVQELTSTNEIKIGDPAGRTSYTSTTTPKNVSFLKEFCKDLTELALKNALDPVVGRDNEIKRLVQILSRRTKSNPILIGEPGVGKTAIVEGLAQRIIKENVPKSLINKRILILDLAAVIAGTKYRGEFEERIKRIIHEIVKDKNIILFIDEIHTIIGAGGAEGAMDASNLLKPALSRGEIQCIGSTTLVEYRKYFEKDAALERRFQSILVQEPEEQDLYAILLGIKERFEAHHHVQYPESTLKTIVSLTNRYVNDRFFPDKAIDVLDEAGALKNIEINHRPSEIDEGEQKIKALVEEKNQLVSLQDYEHAALIRDEIRFLREKINTLKNNWFDQEQPIQIVTPEDIQHVISIMTGIPITELNEIEMHRLINLENKLHLSVVGQDQAITSIAHAIRRSRVGISPANRPLGSFIFLGPTGVGKTLLAKTLAQFLFGNEDALIRIDMSDYMEKHNASRLVGAPPGYVGYEEGGLLTEKIKRKPYSVILFDEIEKAHPDVFNLLLQVLEEGELRDSHGQLISFRNTVLILTSNAGARQISYTHQLGFSTNSDEILEYQDIKSNALAEFKKLFNPEFINRIDDVIVFSSLNKNEIAHILEIQLKDLSKRLANVDLSLTITNVAKKYLIENGYTPEFGARPMRRLIQKKIEDPLALMLVSGEVAKYSTIQVKIKDKELFLEVKKDTISDSQDKRIITKSSELIKGHL